MLRLLLLTLLISILALLSACGESETTFQLPVSPDEHISYTIDGQEISLRSFSSSIRWERNYLDLNRWDGRNELRMTRTNEDRSITMTIIVEDVPVTREGDGFSFLSEDPVAATIRVEGFEMSGGLYCPHVEEDTDAVEYQANVRLTKLNSTGLVTGTFATDPAAGNAAELEEGTFRLAVDIH